MSVGMPITGWAREPFLVINEDFDKNINATSITATATSIFSGEYNASWVGQAITNSGSIAGITGITFKLGNVQMVTGVVSGDGIGIGVDLGLSDLTTPVCLLDPPNTYRWDFWISTGTVTAVDIFAGIADTPIGALGDGCYAKFSTGGAVSTTNWVLNTATGGVTTETDSGVAVVASTWYKISGVQYDTGSNRRWDLYINDIKRASSTSNLPQAPVTPFVRVRTRTAALRSMILGHCCVWIDGSNMIT